MYSATIDLHPGNPNYPLPPLWIGNSTAGKLIFANLPAETSSATLTVLAPNASDPVTASVILPTTGQPYAWILASAVPSIGQGTYELTASIDGQTVWLGKGQLNVIQATQTGTPMEAVTSGGLFVPNGGGYYRLLSWTIEAETSEPTITISNDRYRFNSLTGAYELVS